MLVGHSTPLAPSAEIARHNKHNTDFQAEGRASIKGVLQEKGEESLPSGLDERFVSEIQSRTTTYKPLSTLPIRAHPDLEKLRTSFQAKRRVTWGRETERVIADTWRASPSMLPERMARGNDKIEQRSDPQITSNSGKDMKNGKQPEQLEDIIKNIQQGASQTAIMVQSIRSTIPTKSSNPNLQAATQGRPDSETIILTPDSGGRSNIDDVGTSKSSRLSMKDPCYKVLPYALKKYKINDDWRQYALYLVYGDQERCLGLEEKPLILFKQLEREGKKPMFMLRCWPGDNRAAPIA